MIRSAGSRRPSRSSSSSRANPFSARSPTFIPWSARAMKSGTPYRLLNDQSVSPASAHLGLQVQPPPAVQAHRGDHPVRALQVDAHRLDERPLAVGAPAIAHPELHAADERYAAAAERHPDRVGPATALHGEDDAWTGDLV